MIIIMAMIIFTTIVVETALIAPHDSIISIIIMVIFMVTMIINHVQHNTYKLYSDTYIIMFHLFSQLKIASASMLLSLKTQLKIKGHFCPFYYKIPTKISRLLFELQPLVILAIVEIM